MLHLPTPTPTPTSTPTPSPTPTLTPSDCCSDLENSVTKLNRRLDDASADVNGVTTFLFEDGGTLCFDSLNRQGVGVPVGLILELLIIQYLDMLQQKEHS